MDYIYITSHGRKWRVVPKVYNGMYRFCTEVLKKENEVMERLQALFDENILWDTKYVERAEEDMVGVMKREFLYPIPEEHEMDAEIYWESFLDDHYYNDEEKLILKERALLDLECDYYLIAKEEYWRRWEEYGFPYESIDVFQYRLKKKKKEAFERYMAQLK